MEGWWLRSRVTVCSPSLRWRMSNICEDTAKGTTSVIVRRKNKSGKCVSGRRGFLSNRHICQSVSQSGTVGALGGGDTADVERRSIRSASPCSGLSDRRGRCVCVCACEVCVCVCVPAGFKWFRRTAAPSAWRADAEQTRVVKVGDFHLDSGRDGGGGAAAAALSRERNLSPLPPGPWRATRDDGWQTHINCCRLAARWHQHGRDVDEVTGLEEDRDGLLLFFWVFLQYGKR